MAAAIPYIMVVAAGISAVGAIRQGQAAKAASAYNADIENQNAQLAREESALLQRQHDRDTYMRLGAIRANQAKSGGASGEGSVLDVLGDVAAQSELERQNIQYVGELKARGHTNTATLDSFRGDYAYQSSQLRAGSELLGGVSSGYMANQRLTRT